MAASRTALESDDLHAAAKRSLANFLDTIERWTRDAKDMAPADLAELVLEESGGTSANKRGTKRHCQGQEGGQG